jgi:hypothetical protein
VNAEHLAILAAAALWAVAGCAAIYLLIRLSRLVSAANRLVADHRERSELVLREAQAAIGRAGEQLLRADRITASMHDVTDSMAELSGRLLALTDLARSVSEGFGSPLLRLSALAFGVRRAMLMRRLARVGGQLRSADSSGTAGGPGVPAADRSALPAGSRASGAPL